MNINYSNKSLLKVEGFILYLKKYYKSIYSDTWLLSEEQIISWYIEKTEELFDEIINKIEENVNKWYFWNVIEKHENFEISRLVVWVRSYNVKILIKKSWNDIFIEDILF